MDYDVRPQDLISFLDQVTRKAGQAVVSLFQGKFSVHRKGTSDTTIDIVTDADRASEDIILGEISRQFPSHDILTEETMIESTGSRWLWLVDPLDGTVNFAHGIPHFGISIALAEHDKVVVGIVYDPLRDESFLAYGNGGAFLNGGPIQVSVSKTLRTSVIATGFPYDRATSPENNVAEFCRVVTRVQGIRRAGAASLDLAYVAAGRLDGFWELKLKPWDQAAGMLLVEEAGGRVSDNTGSPTSFRTRFVVATNGLIHDELITRLRGDS
ncbi:MAG: inositol monophosphatase [Deltaproteobacteria bacterium]|nr:inositol monophosphatase [Deltaproteobacteria bacterium]